MKSILINILYLLFLLPNLLHVILHTLCDLLHLPLMLPLQLVSPKETSFTQQMLDTHKTLKITVLELFGLAYITI